MPADTLAEKAWWTRVERAAKSKGVIGSKVLSDWTHDVLWLQTPELDFGRQPVPPGWGTDEYIEHETRRLNDELGRRLGVGPMPCS